MFRLLLSAILVLCFGCSGQESTILTTPEGWDNVGTLAQPLIRKVFDAHTPASETYDFNQATQLDWPGPFWIGLSGWTQTEDASAGALIFDLNYEDPTGQTRVLNFGSSYVLLLNDDTSFFSTPIVSMVRNSGTSLWELQTTLAGSALTSTVHYEIMVSPHEQAAVQPFAD